MTFKSDIEGYLQAEPWVRYTGFLDTYENFKSSYQKNLARWYEEVMKQFDLSSRDFSRRQWSKDFSILESLRKMEELFRRNADLRDFVLTESNRALRMDMFDRLERLYIKVNALDQFDSTYHLSEDGLDSLRATIRSFPNGEERLAEQNKKLEQTRGLFNSMQKAINDKRYSELQSSLQSVLENLKSGKNTGLWSIMASEFLLATRDKITTPQWQPTTGDAHTTYREIVRLYGRLGSNLGLKSLSKQWVDQTLVALKSRRFNQLKHDLLKTVESLESSEIPQVIERLKEIQNIEDLPDELSSRSEAIVYEVALLERLQTGTTKIRDNFSKLFETRSQFRSGWAETQNLSSIIESDPGLNFLKENNLKQFVSRWGEWIDKNTKGSLFDELIQKYAKQTLLSFVDDLVDEFKSAVRQPDESTNYSVLLKRYENIAGGLKLVQNLPGVDPSYGLSEWRNIILNRRHLRSLLNNIENLKEGSLWSSNESFNGYKTRLQELEWLQIPPNYSPNREVRLIRVINTAVKRKTIQVKEASKDQWLAGWGGRVRPEQIINPWISFLERLNQQTRHPDIAAAATTAKQASETTRGEMTR
ncbi:MAG: hypothetical protein ABEK50_07420 [bacterium]